MWVRQRERVWIGEEDKSCNNGCRVEHQISTLRPIRRAESVNTRDELARSAILSGQQDSEQLRKTVTEDVW
jgi:hypothetical protein